MTLANWIELAVVVVLIVLAVSFFNKRQQPRTYITKMELGCPLFWLPDAFPECAEAGHRRP